MHSTHAIGRNCVGRRSDWSPASPTTLGSYNKRFLHHGRDLPRRSKTQARTLSGTLLSFFLPSVTVATFRIHFRTFRVNLYTAASNSLHSRDSSLHDQATLQSPFTSLSCALKTFANVTNYRAPWQHVPRSPWSVIRWSRLQVLPIQDVLAWPGGCRLAPKLDVVNAQAWWAL